MILFIGISEPLRQAAHGDARWREVFSPRPFFPLLGTLAVMLVILRWEAISTWAARWAARNQLEKLDPKERWIDYTFGLDEVTIRTSKVSSTVRWSHFHACFETEGGLLLVGEWQDSYWVGAAGFSSDIQRESFENLVRSRVSEYRVDEFKSDATPAIKMKQDWEEL
jgi:hypothetical protein